VNEPSAAASSTPPLQGTITSRREHVVVYDLARHFDASLLKMSRERTSRHEPGVVRLGGDDFDEAILASSCPRPSRSSAEKRALLFDECIRQKEAVTPNSKRFVVDLSASAASRSRSRSSRSSTRARHS